jgi:FKBP-type peptidyl-prolyl cis-trans isomerase SlyD
MEGRGYDMTDKVQDNLVVTLDYTLMVDDEVLESTQDGEAIQFIQGIGQIIPGLESAIYDMKVGDKKTVVIDPEDAYGIYDDESTQVAKKDEFSEEIPLDVGTFLDLEDDEGEILSAQIIAEDEETVTLDFNHPLAGKTLTFEIIIAGIREATPEELDHRHVH